MSTGKQQTFADRLLALMEAAGLNQSKLAVRLDVSRSTVLDWCEGKAKPQRRTATALGEVLGVNPVWLRTGKGEKAAPALADRGRAVDRRKAADALARAERALSDLRKIIEE